MRAPIPVGGYPSQSAAVRALMSEGLTQAKDIAERTGIPIANVYTLVSMERKRAKSAASAEASPLEEVAAPDHDAAIRRVLTASLAVIANAYGRTIKDVVAILAAMPVPDEAAGREDDEAELEALDESADDFTDDASEDAAVLSPAGWEEPSVPVDEVASDAQPVAAPQRVKLRNEAGEYLHEHTHGMTRLPKFIWRGTADEAKSLKRKKPHLRPLIEEICL